jgi:hypothetical protein
MDHRKQLGMALALVLVAIILTMLAGSRGALVPVILIGLLLVVPAFACRYAVMDLQRESYFTWFLLSMLPHVPVILLLEKQGTEQTFAVDMKIDGREAASYGLGKLTHFYGTGSHSYLGWKIASVILAFMMAPMVVLPFLSKENANSLLGNLLPFVFVLLLAGLFIWLINRQEKKSGQRWVALFADGLACAWPGPDLAQFKWSEVQEVWQEFRDQYVNGMRTVHRRRCRVVTPAFGKGIEFTEKLKNIEDLTAQVHTRATPFLLQRLGEALGSGQTLAFGKLTLSEQGVTLKNQTLPWSDLAGIYLDSGFVVIARQAHSSAEARLRKTASGISAFATRIVGTAQPYAPGGDAVIWKKTPIDQTPNPFTLTLLVSEIMQRMSSQTAASS